MTRPLAAGAGDIAVLETRHGGSVAVRVREFNEPPFIWAAEGWRTSRAGRDHAAVGRLLGDAGSPIGWQTGAEPAEAIVEIVNAWRGVG